MHLQLKNMDVFSTEAYNEQKKDCFSVKQTAVHQLEPKVSAADIHPWVL